MKKPNFNNEEFNEKFKPKKLRKKKDKKFTKKSKIITKVLFKENQFPKLCTSSLNNSTKIH